MIRTNVPNPHSGHGSLSADERRRLLRIARATVAHYLAERKRPRSEDLGVEITAAMKAPAGAFVTLHKGRALRGCIGEMDSERSLCEVVMDHALNAAFKDPRFDPVTEAELADIDFEISALTPPCPIDSWRDIEVGRHGVVLRARRVSSVFLPQVATEQDWDVQTMLEQLSRKAGLPADAWCEPDTHLFVFEATVFGERTR